MDNTFPYQRTTEALAYRMDAIHDLQVLADQLCLSSAQVTTGRNTDHWDYVDLCERLAALEP